MHYRLLVAFVYLTVCIIFICCKDLLVLLQPSLMSLFYLNVCSLSLLSTSPSLLLLLVFPLHLVSIYVRHVTHNHTVPLPQHYNISTAGPPQDLIAEALSSTRLNVSWSPPDAEPLYYRVQVNSPYVDEITSHTFYEINGRTPCSSSTVTVWSEYDDDSYSDTTTGTTDAAGEFLFKSCCAVEVYVCFCFIQSCRH